MAKYVIHVAAENCSGCLRCELGCSFAYARAFNPSTARIQVALSGADCEIRFAEECIKCGICVDQCLYSALSKTKKEEDEQ